MKKISVIFAITLMLVFAFAACGSQGNTLSRPEPETSTQTETAAPEKLTDEPANQENVPHEMKIQQTLPEGVIGISLLPTMAAAYIDYGWGYYIPDNQELWKEKWTEAYSHVSTIDTTPIPWKEFFPVSVNLGNETGFLLHKDGSLWFLDMENNYIAPEDAAEIYSMVEKVMEEAGIHPITPEKIRGISSAVLSIHGENHELTDTGSLSQLENTLSQAKLVPGLMTRCPFTSTLTFTAENAEKTTVAIAADGCGLWMTDGVCYQFASSSDALYALFGISLTAQ